MTTLTTRDALAIDTFRAEGDGCLGYLLVDEAGALALAIDPRLDQVGTFQEALASRGARLAYVLDTHTHADHLSGVRALARRTGATVLAHTASKLAGRAQRVAGGMTLPLGATAISVLDAPGHTPDSLAILAGGHLFTGDALFVRGAGRTDFMGGSASDLFETFRRFEALPDATVVHPGHDYVGQATSTIGEEKATNPLLRQRDREAFLLRLSAAGTPPANMAAILRHNLGEAETATIAPQDVQALRGGSRDVFLLDVRSELEFESERIEGAVNVPLDVLLARLDTVPEQADVVVVCRTGVRATMAAESLGGAGRRARVLEGGVLAWRRARLPLRQGRRRLPVDRQVQLIVGTMVLASVALGAFVSPWLLLLAVFFGAGLTFAGATGTCGLALVLLRMPWNRLPATPAEGGVACAAPGPSACAAPPAPRS